MSLTCTFENEDLEDGRHSYVCKIKYQSVPSKTIEIKGDHLSGKKNDNIDEVRFENCNIPKVPTGLIRIFPNLFDLSICRSNLKLVCHNDLIEYRNLKYFFFYENEIEFVPGNLFEEFKSIKQIGLNGNKLLMIEPALLYELNKLIACDISDNPRYTTNFLMNDEEANATLEDVRAEIAQVYAENVEEHLVLRKKYKKEIKERDKLDDDALDTTLEHEKVAYKPQSDLFKDLKEFIQDEATKDFQIQINDHNFPVHKFLLAARSPTLAEIIKNNPEVENLNLVDISVEIFEMILKFLYTDQLPEQDGTNYLLLFAATGKLKIHDLKNYSAMKLIEQIETENAVDLLNLSNKYEHEELKQKSFKQLKKNYPKIKFKDEWKTNPETVTKIIEIYIKKEEAIKKLEEEFENVRMSK